jgi:hypothetical protein
MQRMYRFGIANWWNLLLALIIASCPIAAWAQNATFTGHVLDPTGAVVPNARVIIHNEKTNVVSTTKTNSAGIYTVPYLIPGTYTISVSAAGFQTVNKVSIGLQAAQDAVINFKLPVGSVSASVTVNGAGSLLDRGSATRGEEVENTRVTELPLNGRNPVMLDRLNSSVIWNGNLIWMRPFDGQVWTNLDVNGSGNYNTEIMVDGQPDQTTRPQNGGHTNGGYVAPDDSTQDFKIVTNPYNAEYGQTRGGVIDLDLKSGTNQLHGDVYEFARRTWLDANWWVNDAQKVLNPTKRYLYSTPQHKLDQYGAELDGPVDFPKFFNGRNKLFFVAQYENWNEVEPAYADTSVPCTASTCGDWASGDFSGMLNDNVTIYDPYSTYNCTVSGKPEICRNPFPDNKIPTGMINPVAQALLKYYPAPNQPGVSGAPWEQNFYTQEPTVDRYRNALIKLDWDPTEKDKYSLWYGYWERYETDISNGILTGPAGYGEDPLGDREHTFAAEWVHTFSPNLLMDLMAHVDVKAEIAGVAPTGFNLNSIGWPTSLTSQLGGLSMMPGFEPSGFTNLSGGTGNGLTTTDALNLFPSITWVKGKHTFHIGIDWRLGQYAIVQNASTIAHLSFDQGWTQNCWSCGSGKDYTGAESTEGNSIASMLLGLPSSGTDGIGSTAFYSNKYYAPYIQDDWKVTPRLTLNLGVRYDLQPYYVERHNRADYAFDTTTPNPVDSMLSTTTLTTGAPIHDVGGITFLGVNGNPRRVYSTNLTEIQPRFGFAFAASNNTVVRGGFGEMFQQTDAYPVLNGFSSNTNLVNSPDGGLTPINWNKSTGCCFGGNLSNPFSSITQPTGSSLGLLTNMGNGQSYLNPNFQIPNVWQYSLGIEQQITRNDMIELSYVGNIAPNNETSQNINHWSGSAMAKCNVQMGGDHHVCDDQYSQNPNAIYGYVPNPYYNVAAFAGSGVYGQATRQALNWTQALGGAFGGVTEYQWNAARSWYNSLQLTYQHNWSKGLTIHGTWTWSKLMDQGGDGAQNGATNGGGYYADNNYLIPYRSLDNLDRTQNATISMVWDMPIGRGRTFFSNMNHVEDAFLGGWELASMPTFQSGAPYPMPGGWDYVHSAKIKPYWRSDNHNLQWYAPCYWTTNAETGAVSESAEAQAFGCTQPDFIQIPSYGATPWNSANLNDIREPWDILDDSNLSKNFTIHERMTLQVRCDTFNTFNHPVFSGGAYNGIQTITPQGWSVAGQIGSTTGGGQSNKPRYTQVALKLTW